MKLKIQLFFRSCLLSFGVFCFSWSSQSAVNSGMDGYVGLGFQLVNQLNEIESGTRSRLTAEFGRLNKNVSLDLNFGAGQGYRDYGLTFHFFNFFPIPDETSFFRVTIGAAGIANYKSTDEKFWDIGIVLPETKLIFDIGVGVGLSLNMGYEMIFKRNYSTSADSSDFRGRFVVGTSLMLTSALVE
jgi:hypothetical protein